MHICFARDFTLLAHLSEGLSVRKGLPCVGILALSRCLQSRIRRLDVCQAAAPDGALSSSLQRAQPTAERRLYGRGAPLRPRLQTPRPALLDWTRSRQLSGTRRRLVMPRKTNKHRSSIARDSSSTPPNSFSSGRNPFLFPFLVELFQAASVTAAINLVCVMSTSKSNVLNARFLIKYSLPLGRKACFDERSFLIPREIQRERMNAYLYSIF